MGSYDNFGCIKFVWAFRLGVEEIAARARQIFDLFAEGGHLPPYGGHPERLAEMLLSFCLPPNQVTNGQLIKVFVKWATDHPERHHEERDVGLYEA